MGSTTPQDDDQELIERALRADSEAFELLVEKHYDRVFGLVHGILGDWHLCEDVCQEVFTIVYRKLSGFRNRARFSTWLYRVSVNCALKARRRHGRRRLRSLEPGTERVVSTEPPAFENQEVVEQLLRPLSDSLRTVVLLREHAGLTYNEIADVLGCSRGAVEQRLHRAMTQLREIWKKRIERSDS